MGERRSACRILVGKPEERRPHGRSRRRWEDNNTMVLENEDGPAYTRSIWLMIGTGLL
jgi:hypothetical protein